MFFVAKILGGLFWGLGARGRRSRSLGWTHAAPYPLLYAAPTLPPPSPLRCAAQGRGARPGPAEVARPRPEGGACQATAPPLQPQHHNNTCPRACATTPTRHTAPPPLSLPTQALDAAAVATQAEARTAAALRDAAELRKRLAACDAKVSAANDKAAAAAGEVATLRRLLYEAQERAEALAQLVQKVGDSPVL